MADSANYGADFRHGKHIATCGGRCLIADVGCPINQWITALILIVVPSCIWFGVVAVDDVSGQYFFIGWNALFLVLAVTFLLTARYTEPGLLHTNPTLGSMSDREWHGMIKRGEINVLIDGEECSLADARAKMCKETGNAIEKFDHFCPWVGNAVGVRNHKWFVLFISSTLMLSLGTGGGSMYYMVEHGLDGVGVAAMIIFIYCVIITLCVGGLWTYHLGLICNNVTTFEDLKERWGPHSPNTNDKGCCTNFVTICCTAARPSYVGHTLVTEMRTQQTESSSETAPLDSGGSKQTPTASNESDLAEVTSSQEIKVLHS
jgi:hypothetical protein